MSAGTVGRFITVEGIDGAGKSTHLDVLARRWQAQGREVIRTREPGGIPLAESLRTLVLNQPMDALTEALLVFAGRRDHLMQVIEPALARGAWVLCDRFTDATFAYQGGGRQFQLDVLRTLEQWVQGTRQPDLTVWFELPPHVAAQRLVTAREPDRFERMDADFFERVVHGYAARVAAEPARFVCVNANQPIAAVEAELLASLRRCGW